MAKINIASEKTLNDIKNEVKEIHSKLVAAGGGMGVIPHVEVTAPVRSTVTATDGMTVITATEVNGVFQFDVPHFGDWEISTTKDGCTEKQTLSVTQVKSYQVLSILCRRYGYRIKKSEENPDARVEYLFDAVGMMPAHMDFNTGVFDYGDWGDKWFITENKPCMLKSDRTIDYYLDPNDYSKKEDGTPSDIEDTNYDGNAMSLIPLVWVKRYEDDNYLYEIISNVQYDDDYKAYAHTRADGSIADWFAWSIYGGSGLPPKIRSLSGQTLAQYLTAEQEIAGATENGPGWYTHTWSQRELIRTLLILMGKSMDTQYTFGYGNCASERGERLPTGMLNNMGQFYGYKNPSDYQVKVFHIEKFWGDQWDRTAGIIYSDSKVYVKMTPEGSGYRISDTMGYTNTGVTLEGTSGSHISAATCSENGIIPTTISGNGTTFYCDVAEFSNSGLCYLATGGKCGPGYLPPALVSDYGGAFAFSVYQAPSDTSGDIGCGLSCEQPV